MLVYRICKVEYAQDFSGTGAGLYGGRWNPRGVNLLYTAGSISLACLEYLAHNYHVLQNKEICLSKIEIKEANSIKEVPIKHLPKDWKETSYEPFSTQQIGLDFSERKEAHMLKVPSALVPDEFNYLLNPHHPNHSQVKIKEQIIPFELDSRLFGR